MIRLKLIFAVSSAAATLLSACGGGGGSPGAGQASAGQTAAAFAGSLQGSVSSSRTSASGTLTVSDPDAGQAAFTQPASSSLRGLYGTWSFSSVGPAGSWTYSLTTPPAFATTETLTVSSIDGTAQSIVVSIGVVSAFTNIVPSFEGDSAADKLAVLNALNHYRSTCGFGPALLQNTILEKASQSHADYQTLNNVAGHTQDPSLPGFAGEDPFRRMTNVGYEWTGAAAENIGYSIWGPFYNDIHADAPRQEPSATRALKALLSSVYHLGGLMSPATEVGIGVSNQVYSETSFRKVLNIKQAIGVGSEAPIIPASEIKTFPCAGVSDLRPTFRGENPDPFPDFNNDSRESNPYGQPVYITTGISATLTLTSSSFRLKEGNEVPTRLTNADNDPHKRLQPNQLFVTPTERLADNATYVVILAGTNTGHISSDNPTGSWTRNFEFTTGTSAGN